MQIRRRHATEGEFPYDGIAFCIRFRGDAAEDGPASAIDARQPAALNPDALITAPADWSDEAVRVFATRCAAGAGVPDSTEPVPEDDVPECLWRRRPAPDAAFGPETDVRQVFDRFAGALACQGWQAGYFDSAADARAFYDGLRAAMCRREVLPDCGLLRHAGLWWAYGVEDDAPAGFVTDYRSGAVRRAGPGDIPASGPVIHGVTDDIAGEGGVMDLWRREAAGLAAGNGAGVNVSALGTEPGPGLMAQLGIGDGAARAFATQPGATRFITLDAGHADAARFAEAPAAARAREAAARAGARLATRHLEAIVAAGFSASGAHRLDPAANPALRFALIAAREAMVPWATVERLLTLIADGYDQDTLRDFAALGDAPPPTGPITRRALRADDATLEAAGRDRKAAALVESVSRSAWHAGACGLFYADAAEGWNPCPASGTVRAAAADGGHLFLDDTGSSRVHLNLEAFIAPGGRLDADALSHATWLSTVALDIAIGITAQPTPRLAARAWEFRAIGLAPGNIAGALMSLGLAYDSGNGRALAAAAVALVTAAACRCSAAMAEEMGAFPAFARNRDDMQRVLENHARAAAGSEGGYVALGWAPVALQHGRCPDTTLARRAAQTWDKACGEVAERGLRNAQFTQVSTDAMAAALMGAAAPGAEPASALAAFEALPGGGFRRTPSPRIATALRALGYREDHVADMLRFVAGHGTLARAPGIDHAALRRCGFGEAALRSVETALAGTFDIRFVFSRWTLGDRFCTGVLGLDAAAMDADGFDLLNALGFSDETVSAANGWCFGAGTLDGAPHLRADHVAVFDTAQPGAADADGGRRVSVEGRVHMLAALQPFVSGGVAHALTMPAGATPEDCRDALMLGWRLGLKHLVLGRAADAPAGAYDGGWAKADALYGGLARRRRDEPVGAMRAALNVIEGGRVTQAPRGARAAPGVAALMSQALALAHTARGVAPAGKDRNLRTGVAAASGAADGAEASRRQASKPPGSGTSVSSSTDVPVEQRQV